MIRFILAACKTHVRQRVSAADVPGRLVISHISSARVGLSPEWAPRSTSLHFYALHVLLCPTIRLSEDECTHLDALPGFCISWRSWITDGGMGAPDAGLTIIAAQQ